MSYAGHVFDMINRLKQNEAQRKRYKNRYAKVKEAYLNELHGDHPIRKLNLSKEDTAQIKAKIRSSMRRQRIVGMIKSIVITLVVMFVIVFVLYRISGLIQTYSD